MTKDKATPKNNKWKDPFWANKQCDKMDLGPVGSKDRQKFITKMKEGKDGN